MMPAELRRATADLAAPYGIIDRAAFDANAAALRARAGGLPIRVASKSLRIPEAIARVLATEGYAGVLAFGLREALFLHARGIEDILVAYPTVDRPALTALAADPAAAAAITVMVDDTAHLDLITRALDAAAGGGTAGGDEAGTGTAETIRVCIDIDAAYRLGRMHIGARRSPIREVADALGLLAEIAARPRLSLVGLMAYEGQIAGVPNAGRSPSKAVLRGLQRRSARELAARRGRIVAAVREQTDLEFVNGGGTGSLEVSAADASLTEVAAGSGLLAPGSFDGFAGFRHTPAAYFATPVVRTPGPDWVTVAGGGWIASGAPGADRLPSLAWPPQLAFSATEGMGEVQTPLHGPGARRLRIGDPVFFRHAKAGELAEHLETFAVVAGGRIVEHWPTYRGLGLNAETGSPPGIDSPHGRGAGR